MMIEEELSQEAPAKTGSNWKSNYQNKDKKASSSKEVRAIHHFIEYILMGTTYTQALERLLIKGKIKVPKIKPKTNALRQYKTFGSTSIVSTTSHEGMTLNIVKPNGLERMFRLGQLPLPKVAQKPSNDKNPLGDHESIFIVNEQKENGTIYVHTK